MNKILSIGILLVGFLIASPQASAQHSNEEVWNKVEEQTERFTKEENLSDNETAYLNRYLVAYHQRISALKKGVDNLPFDSKTEVKERLMKEVRDLLEDQQFENFKAREKELLKNPVEE